MKNLIKLFLAVTLILVTTESHSKGGGNKVQIALLLDTSNSMDGLIDQAKGKLWTIVNELNKCKKEENEAEIEIALYVYGNDNLDPKEYWIKQILPFTTDLDKISERLFKLRTKGGSEYCGAVIKSAMKDLSWSNDGGDLKMIFIAGNESFAQGPIKYRAICEKAAKNDIKINTIYCGDYETGIHLEWKEAALIGKGNYSNIDHEKSIQYIATPFDEEIYKLNKLLNNTYIVYGSKGNEYKKRQESEDINAESFSKANAVDRAVSKASNVYKSTEWDLVDAYQRNKEVLKSIQKANLLPLELKNKSSNEIENYIHSKSLERNEIKTKIIEYQNKRLEYLKENKHAEMQFTLEEAFMSGIREAAITKGFTFRD